MTVEELKKELDKYPNDAIIEVYFNVLYSTATSTPTSIEYDEKNNNLYLGFN